MVSLMTALWFGVLEAPDRVSVKPHASPVLHAHQPPARPARPRLPDDAAPVRRAAVLPVAHQGPRPGRLLDRLGRARRDRAGLGRARAPLRGGALRRPVGGRQIALIGDAELDEGACWEAIADPMVSQARRGHVGRRPQPPVARPRRARHRRGPAAGDVRGGRLALRDGQVRAAARRAARAARAHRPDAERGVPAAAARAGAASCASGSRSTPAASTTPRCWRRSATSAATTSARCSTATARPTPCATARASCSPTRSRAGRCRPRATRRTTPRCSRTSSTPTLAAQLGADPEDPWAPFAAGQRARPRCAPRPARRLAREDPPAPPSSRPPVPADLGREHKGTASTQQAFGRFFVDLEREAPDVAARVVTVSPDVGTSTNLGGWINKQGIWSVGRPHRLVRRRHRHARALARVRPRPPHRAGHRRGQPRRPARRAGRDVAPGRPAAAAGRHDLRPVRRPRARAVVVRRSTPAGSRSSSARRAA